MDIFYRSRLWTFTWLYILAIYLSLPVMRNVLDYLRETLGADRLSLTLNLSLTLAGLCLVGMGARRGVVTLAMVIIPLGILGLIVYQLHIPEERVHFLQYGLLGILVAGTAREYAWRTLLYLALFVIAVGTGDEIIQWLLPNRVGDMRDVAMNTAAGTLGIWIGKSLLWESSSHSASFAGE